MNEEKELERHNRIIKQIENAQKREDLPNVGFSNIASYLATNVYFNNKKISQTLYKPVIDSIINTGLVTHEEVLKSFIKVIHENYPEITEEEIVAKFKSIIKSQRINYILTEITKKNLKLSELVKEENLTIHKQMIKEIKSAFDIKDLPKIGLSELNKKLLRAVNDNDFVNDIKTSEIKELTKAYLEKYPMSEIEEIIKRLVSKYSLTEEEKKLMEAQIVASLMMDETIDYTVEEILLKEERKEEIYRLNHEEIMDRIKESKRISHLPPNLTISTLNSYLNGNTTIYPKDNRIVAEDLKVLTNLLMDGYKWEDDVIKKEIQKIAERKYSEKSDAFNLLYNKLIQLPRTYYLVEEIKYSLERQTEFVGRNCSNVNIYFIPNSKSPTDGGRFYNCYINRADNLDLSAIMPLDIDSLEWYVQEHIDDTFKTAGAIILNRDETIGNVSVFKPNDGTIGVQPEEKKKMDEINDLDAEIEAKKRLITELDNEIRVKQNNSLEAGKRLRTMLTKYEQKALRLQMEIMTQISELKSEFGVEEESELKRG